jgi:cytochrome c553
MKKLALTVIALFGIISIANGAGNVAAGEEKSAMCQGCHGPDGNSPMGDFPSLAGQHDSYLIKQLNDFKAGKRSNEMMDAIAPTLSDEDITDIAAYFSSQKITAAGTEADAKIIAMGKSIYMGGKKKTSLTACTGCHGPNATGNRAAKFPSLAGQHADYISSQLLSFSRDERTNDMNKMMRNIANTMKEREIAAVAAYLASLPE